LPYPYREKEGRGQMSLQNTRIGKRTKAKFHA
jgi:hypothetical protein